MTRQQAEGSLWLASRKPFITINYFVVNTNCVRAIGFHT